MLIFSFKCLFLDSTTVALHDSQLFMFCSALVQLLYLYKKNPVLALKCKKTNKQKKGI